MRVPVRLEAVVGDAIIIELGLVGVTGVNLTSIVVAAISATIVLVVYDAVRGQRASYLSATD